MYLKHDQTKWMARNHFTEDAEPKSIKWQTENLSNGPKKKKKTNLEQLPSTLFC